MHEHAHVDLSDFIESIALPVFSRWRSVAPWLITAQAPAIVRAILADLEADEFEISDEVAVHRSASVEHGVVLKGPLIVGAHCFLAAGAYLRGGNWLSERCVVGPGSEVKASFLFAGTRLAHFNFVGNSMLGADVNLEGAASSATTVMSATAGRSGFARGRASTRSKRTSSGLSWATTRGSGRMRSSRPVRFSRAEAWFHAARWWTKRHSSKPKNKGHLHRRPAFGALQDRPLRPPLGGDSMDIDPLVAAGLGFPKFEVRFRRTRAPVAVQVCTRRAQSGKRLSTSRGRRSEQSPILSKRHCGRPMTSTKREGSVPSSRGLGTDSARTSTHPQGARR